MSIFDGQCFSSCTGLGCTQFIVSLGRHGAMLSSGVSGIGTAFKMYVDVWNEGSDQMGLRDFWGCDEMHLTRKLSE